VAIRWDPKLSVGVKLVERHQEPFRRVLGSFLIPRAEGAATL